MTSFKVASGAKDKQIIYVETELRGDGRFKIVFNTISLSTGKVKTSGCIHDEPRTLGEKAILMINKVKPEQVVFEEGSLSYYVRDMVRATMHTQITASGKIYWSDEEFYSFF